MADRAEAYSYARITTATTTQVRTGPGVLKRIIVNVPVSTGTIGLIDGQSGSTVNIGTITSTADLKPFFIDFDIKVSSGLRIVTTQAQDITVVYA
jgi:hypothetical protein